MSFIKNNPTGNPKAMHMEAAGLKALSDLIQQLKLAIHIPKVISVDDQQLSLERIVSRKATQAQWQLLGDQLAVMHKARQQTFGYTDDNYIGLNPQKNGLFEDWGRFFYQQRLLFQCQLIKDPHIRAELQDTLSNLQTPLINWLNELYSLPSLLHGDLWSGNVLFSEDKIWLIDPAVYWGDAEADIAMTELFGGFPKAFYGAYHAQLPRSAQYPIKKICYNLYHYLNHYNLFGHGYLAACRNHLNQLSNALT
ncbi:fructosamine kinase family protein [Marinicella gelatinilytica]|uniref:fructosamine kinase family protein n=1 Tax=Marinicella gelatinilytica TaxID=2996017 RepID=UPI002260FAB0|nr:fructosamine kinase family protein [Marinicella gelatinilytica]MCX7544224.1 fructosamine kinase family protein [Marinicella gelatinilytica]